MYTLLGIISDDETDDDDDCRVMGRTRQTARKIPGLAKTRWQGTPVSSDEVSEESDPNEKPFNVKKKEDD